MLAGKDFTTKAIGEIKESPRGPQNPAPRLQGKEQCSKISRRHRVGEAMLDVVGHAMCASNTGCCKVPFSYHLSTESNLGISYFFMTLASHLESVEMGTSNAQCPGHVPNPGHKCI